MCVGLERASALQAPLPWLSAFVLRRGPLTDLERTNQPKLASQRALRILLCCLSSAGVMNMPQHTQLLSLFYLILRQNLTIYHRLA